MQANVAEPGVTSAAAPTPAAEPALPLAVRPTSGMNPLHSQTESTLAPTSEFVRLFLLGWTVRYIFRGGPKEIFSDRTFDAIRRPMTRMVEFFAGRSARRMEEALAKAEHQPVLRHLASKSAAEIETFFSSRHRADPGIDASVRESGQKLYASLRKEIGRWRGKPEEDMAHIINDHARGAAPALSATSLWRIAGNVRNGMHDMAYSLALGLSSAALSFTYSRMVRSDIRNMFSEVVAYEKGITPDQVKFSDIAASSNRIIQRTVHNYRVKLAQRLGTDALFFGFAPFKSEGITDILLGVKGTQILAETWKRKPTLFEDLVTLVNNKINPRNGLGQQVTVGEVFDLYQHYAEQFSPHKMFHNVLERGSGEGAIWAKSEPIFERITQLMNLTYAYKHPTQLDASGQTVEQANFPLPKLIYLLGRDLIDPREPERTLAYIEIANRYGMEEVKMLEEGLRNGKPLAQLLVNYPAIRLAPRLPENARPAPAAPNSITQVNHPEKAPEQTLPKTTVNSASSQLHPSSAPVYVPSL